MPKKAFFALDAQRRQTLIERAMDIHIEHSYEEINLKILLDGLELNPATFYRYFDNRDELYVYLMELVDEKVLVEGKANYPELSDKLFFPKNLDKELLTSRERAFSDTLFSAPDYILLRVCTGRSKEVLFAHAKNALRKMRYDGKLRAQVDEDMAAYMFATSMFNLMLFFKEFGIDEPEMQVKMRHYLYRDFFLYGMMGRDN